MLRQPHRPRFVRLSAEHSAALLGEGVDLVPWMVISSGRFVARQRVAMIGPAGRIDGVAVVGPLVDRTVVSLSDQDEQRLGLKQEAPQQDAVGVLLVGPAGEARVSL